MITQQSQIKINLPLALKEFLESRAGRFGMPLAGYIKHLILKDVEEMDYPTFQASKQTELAFKQAIKDQKTGKLVRVDDVEKFFKEL